MAKVKSVFFCQNCGAESVKWVGQCPACHEWNSLVEEIVSSSKTPPSLISSTSKAKPINLQEVDAKHTHLRYDSGIDELNRVLGGGIVEGSLLLVGGEPGIGKSTLMLQMAVKLTKKTLYVTGEESIQQTRLRADRLGFNTKNCYLLPETNLSNIIHQAEQLLPQVMIIDSVQTMFSQQIESPAGSMSQVKECTAQLMKYCKQNNVTTFLIGHINKEGAIAGPKVLEHMVDTVLQFEGQKDLNYRMIRTIKNRFGATHELGFFEMRENGLQEVKNPSKMLISERDESLSGIALGSSVEGNRPLIIETQALVSPTNYSTPQRSTTGYDYKRLTMLLAVMEKRLGLNLSNKDVFLNITGGLKVLSPSIDLAVCAAIYSSYKDVVIPLDICFAGEVGLGGEIRPSGNLLSIISEAEKLGFKKLCLSKYGLKNEKIKENQKLSLLPFSKLSLMLHKLF